MPGSAPPAGFDFLPEARDRVRDFLGEKTDPRPPAVVVAGPTASGKTALGIALARENWVGPAAIFSKKNPPAPPKNPAPAAADFRGFSPVGGEILAVDSRTVYRGLDLGTAKPTAAERAAAPHHLLDLFDPTESVDAFSVGEIAREKAREILARGKLPIFVGGTGLWLEAAAGVLAPPPGAADPGIRAAVGEISTEKLLAELAAADPATAENCAGNRRRLERAVEILRATGRPPADQKSRADGPFRVLWLVLDPPREPLRARIFDRTKKIFAGGFLTEARALFEKNPPDAPALSAIGYPEARAVLAGEISESAAVERVAIATAQYAKRQRTWWRHRDLPVVFLRGAAG